MRPAAAPPWYYWLLAAPLLALAALPLPVLYGLAGGIYLLLRYGLRYRRRVVLDNLRHAFPEKTEAEVRRISHRFYWHFAQMLVEIVKLAGISERALQRRVRFLNPELIAAPVAAGRTVLVLGSHLSNWEWMLARAGAISPGQIAGVYKPLSNKFFEWFTQRLRTRFGSGAVAMAHTLRFLVQRRGQGQALGLLLDQAAGPVDRPYWTDFLHRDAGFYTSAERLAAQFQAVVLYVGVRRVRRGYYEVFLRELPAAPATPPTVDATDFSIIEAFVRYLEADIRAAPEQYLWTHRRWKHRRNDK